MGGGRVNGGRKGLMGEERVNGGRKGLIGGGKG